MADRFSKRLAEILAEMFMSAIDGDQRVVAWALESGATLVAPCKCKAAIGDQVCVCAVEPALPRAYVIRAADCLSRSAYVGRPPSRRCLLCLRGEHDLADTHPVTVVDPDGKVVQTFRSPSHAGHSRRHERAHAFPAGTWKSQREAARGAPPSSGRRQCPSDR
jgi:hypothetical protein